MRSGEPWPLLVCWHLLGGWASRSRALGRLADLAIGEGRACCLPAGDAADATASVGRRAAVVQAADGSAVVGVAGSRAHVEELLKGELAVEDVAADQAVLLLHLMGPDDVAVQD